MRVAIQSRSTDVTKMGSGKRGTGSGELGEGNGKREKSAENGK